MKSLFLAPHHDDETLWGAFTLIRARPDVAVCLLSVKQEAYGITQETRAAETTAALAELGLPDTWRQWAYPDSDPDWHEIAERIRLCADVYDHVYAPAVEDGGHEQHSMVGQIALEVFGPERVTSYLTYRRGHGRSRSEHEVPYEPGWVPLKLRALACYRSQIESARAGCRRWFVDDPVPEYVSGPL